DVIIAARGHAYRHEIARLPRPVDRRFQWAIEAIVEAVLKTVTPAARTSDFRQCFIRQHPRVCELYDLGRHNPGDAEIRENPQRIARNVVSVETLRRT